MKEEEIEYAIENIMINNGPDGHCDGADIITDFVMALLRGEGSKWVKRYEALQEKAGYNDSQREEDDFSN